MDIITKAEAKGLGLRHYFTGKPCCRGHVAPREIKGHCVECRKEDNNKPENIACRRRYSQTDKAKQSMREGGIKFRQTEKHAEYQADWRKKNSDKVKATQKRYYDKNRASRIALSKEVQARDPEKKRERMRSWQKKNPEKCVQHAQKRYATERLSATYIDSERPFIRLMYEMGRELGLAVDHIIPQTHRDVTGLHCLLNLRLLGPIKNMSKSNRFDPERALMCEPF